MERRPALFVFLCLCFGLCGCASDSGVETPTIVTSTAPKGTEMNGARLNGVRANGVKVNGASVGEDSSGSSGGAVDAATPNDANHD